MDKLSAFAAFECCWYMAIRNTETLSIFQYLPWILRLDTLRSSVQLCLPIVLFVRLAIATVTNHQQATLLKHWCGLMGDIRDLGTSDVLSVDISDQPYPLERSQFWLTFACFVFLFHIVKVISKLNLDDAAFLVLHWLNRYEHLI